MALLSLFVATLDLLEDAAEISLKGVVDLDRLFGVDRPDLASIKALRRREGRPLLSDSVSLVSALNRSHKKFKMRHSLLTVQLISD